MVRDVRLRERDLGVGRISLSINVVEARELIHRPDATNILGWMVGFGPVGGVSEDKGYVEADRAKSLESSRL